MPSFLVNSYVSDKQILTKHFNILPWHQKAVQQLSFKHFTKTFYQTLVFRLLWKLSMSNYNLLSCFLLESLRVGWETQDGRVTTKCRVTMGMQSLARDFFVILPSWVFQPSCCVRSLLLCISWQLICPLYILPLSYAIASMTLQRSSEPWQILKFLKIL